jgi:hypothetical protein
MFSRYRDPRQVCVICIALETPDGSLTWWRPHFYRYADIFGRKLATDDLALRLWCASEVLRIVRLEEGRPKGNAEPYRAVHIVERRWIDSSIQDRTLAKVAVSGNTHAL